TREYELQEEKAKLAEKNKQARDQEREAEIQVAKAKGLQTTLETRRKETDKALEELSAQQEVVFKYRLRLRDANDINQKMERDIRALESRNATDPDNP